MAKVNDDADATTTALNGVWKEVPADTANISAGASAIRSTRGALTDTLAQEHYVEVSGTGNSTGIGHHVEGSARVYVERDDGSFGDAVTVDESVGRVRYYPEERRLEVRTPDGWSAAGGVYPGLISYSAVIPVPSEDGWRVCDGNEGVAVDTETDGGIYIPLIKRLAGTDATQAFIPDARDQFIRGHDTMAVGTGRTINDQAGGTSPLEAFPVQAHMVADHHHGVDHDHSAPATEGGARVTITSASSDYTDGSYFTDGTLTMADPSDTNVNGTGSQFVTNNGNIAVNLNHTHEVDIPLYEGFSTGVVGTDNAATTSTGAETRPDNIALYVVIKL